MKLAFAILAAACLVLGSGPPAAAQASVGAVYVMSNAPAGNAVMAYDRAADGTLVHDADYPTGGSGTGGGLGNQGGLVLSDDLRWLFAVNAGSDDLAVFAVGAHGLGQVDLVATGGSTPVSVALHGHLVYVLNAGSDEITGFTQGVDGTLSPIAGSTQPLSGSGVDAAQVGFSRDGRLLVVSEKATDTLTVYSVDAQGLAGLPETYASEGQTPFGFAFGRRNQLFVSEAAMGAAGASTVSSYVADAGAALKLEVVTSSAPTHETAACWVVVDRSGRFAYTTNTGDDTVSGFAISRQGELTLLDADGKTAQTGAGPIDAAISADGRFLYVLDGGDGAVSAFRIGLQGGLSAIAGTAGLPDGANGLAAR